MKTYENIQHTDKGKYIVKFIILSLIWWHINLLNSSKKGLMDKSIKNNYSYNNLLINTQYKRGKF